MTAKFDLPPVVLIVGRSRTGKTTLIERLLPEFKSRGLRAGTVKHAMHPFELDQPGKDSWRHRQAGAETVLVSSPGQIALLKFGGPDSLEAHLKYFTDMDLVLVEGYKSAPFAKIEVVRSAVGPDAVCAADPLLAAVVSDRRLPLAVPCFDLDAIRPIADFIAGHLLRCHHGMQSASNCPG
jgi:molybdopterin-guanine dinucleotide biosynthesis protein B